MMQDLILMHGIYFLIGIVFSIVMGLIDMVEEDGMYLGFVILWLPFTIVVIVFIICQLVIEGLSFVVENIKKLIITH